MPLRPETAAAGPAQILEALDVPAMLVSITPALDVRVNAALRALIGGHLPADAAIALRYFANGKPLDTSEGPVAQALSGTTITAMPLEIERSDGSLRAVLVNATPLRDQAGAITGIFAIVREAERVPPGTLREISINTPALLFTADATGSVDSVNARWTSFIGAGADELLGSGWTRFVHHDDLPRVAEEWKLHLHSGEPFCSQWRFRRADGTHRWAEIRAEAQRDAQGNIKRWFGSGTDIDAQRRALAALDFLAESGATVAGAQDVPALLDRLARASLEGLADISIFDLEDEDGNFQRFVVASPDVPQSTVEITGAFQAPKRDEPHPIARAMASGETTHVPFVDETFIVQSVTPVERQEAWRLVNIRSIVCAPMITPGRAYGALTLLRTGTSVPFEAPDVKVVEEVARRAAVAIENLRLKEREYRAGRDLQGFADLGELLSKSLGLQSTLRAGLNNIVPARADWAFINLIDDQDELRLAAVYHPHDAKRRVLAAHIGERYSLREGEGIVPSVVRTGLPVMRERATYEEGARNLDPVILDAIWSIGVTSVVVVPLFTGSVVRGTLHAYTQNDDRLFTQHDVEFFVEFARRLAPAIANAQLFERERRVARSFQDAALPASLPDVPGFRFRAIYEAGKAEALIGGDWYDAFSLGDGRIVVSIGDVAGSGLSAAVTMAGVRQAIRGAAHVHADPAVMLEAADRATLEDVEHRFVTAFVGVIDPVASTIAFQSAGHPPPLLRLPDGTVTALTSTGLPLGFRGDLAQETQVEPLPEGSLLVLYTDGLTESTHDVLEGEARLYAALRDRTVYGANDPAKMLHDMILTEGSRDDVAILTMQVT
jgi:PAS domain S-box-containing protein